MQIKSEIQQRVDIGTDICKRLKEIYYADSAWPTCYTDVARCFSELKAKARIFYGFLDEFAMLKELSQYSNEDLVDMMGR